MTDLDMEAPALPGRLAEGGSAVSVLVADIGVGGQAKFSQDSIAEFQFVSNRFDATIGLLGDQANKGGEQQDRSGEESRHG